MPTVSYGIANTADDAVYTPAIASAAAVFLGNFSGTEYGGPAVALFRFLGVAVPQGATITEAHIDVTYNPAGPGGVGRVGSGAGLIYGVAQDNVGSTTPANIPSLPKTTASSAVPNTTGTFSIDVTDEAQEVVSRGGWSSGNAMGFVADGSSASTSEWIELYDYSSSTTLCAQLSITYTAGGPPTLSELTLSPATTTEAAVIGDTVGALSGMTAGSTLSLTDSASGRFSLDGSSIKVASALTVGTYSITVRETLDGATNTPRDTSLSITVTEAPPLSFVGSATGTTSATMPAHQAGDLILCWAYRDGSNTLPTLPSGQNWTTLNGVTGANTNSAYLVGKIATSSSEGVGTFTSATSVIVQVYRPRSGYTATWSAVAANTGASTTVNYPALTLQTGDGSSWVAAFSGHRSTNTSLETPPAGMTLRSTVVDATDEAAGFDTNGGVASWPSTNVSVGGTSSGWRSAVVEIVVAVASTRRPPRHSFWL